MKPLNPISFTPTEWDVLEAMHLNQNDHDKALACVRVMGHNMNKKSLYTELREIRKKMYEHSKHLAPSLDSVLNAQKSLFIEIQNSKAKEQEDWREKYENEVKKHSQNVLLVLKQLERIKALEDQCKRADEIIYTKQDTINHMVKKNKFLTGRILILEEFAVSGPVILKAFCGGILLSAAIGYALLVLKVIHV